RDLPEDRDLVGRRLLAVEGLSLDARPEDDPVGQWVAAGDAVLKDRLGPERPVVFVLGEIVRQRHVGLAATVVHSVPLARVTRRAVPIQAAAQILGAGCILQPWVRIDPGYIVRP